MKGVRGVWQPKAAREANNARATVPSRGLDSAEDCARLLMTGVFDERRQDSFRCRVAVFYRVEEGRCESFVGDIYFGKHLIWSVMCVFVFLNVRIIYLRSFMF